MWWPALVSRGVFDGSPDLKYTKSHSSPGPGDLDRYKHKEVTFIPNWELRHGFGRRQGIHAK